MKNRVLAILLLASASAIASVVYADLKVGYYSPAQLGSIRQAASAALSRDSDYQVSAYPVTTVDLAPGDGVEEVRSYCNTCHSPRYIVMQPPLPPATWEAEVQKMDNTFGAGIPPESKEKIIRYLQAHYTPETRKR